jgi:hypothetical protein
MAANANKADPSNGNVEPASGTGTTPFMEVGPACAVGLALTGWTRQNALAAKTSKSLSENFMLDKNSIKHASLNKYCIHLNT